MKTAEELIALKEEVEALNKKLAKLAKEELEQVSGGGVCSIKCSECPNTDCPSHPPVDKK